uniref:hypothetical protein n=1 Tax=Mesorhizobium sp. NZP2298 TaxID=2483403 RepID=UPI001552E01E|nr:hypothetical protein [Mesorhizobium sp. NZP2298]
MTGFKLFDLYRADHVLLVRPAAAADGDHFTRAVGQRHAAVGERRLALHREIVAHVQRTGANPDQHVAPPGRGGSSSTSSILSRPPGALSLTSFIVFSDVWMS